MPWKWRYRLLQAFMWVLEIEFGSLNSLHSLGGSQIYNPASPSSMLGSFFVLFRFETKSVSLFSFSSLELTTEPRGLVFPKQVLYH